MILNFYRPQGHSSFISSQSYNSDFSDYFLAFPDNYNVFFHLALLNVNFDQILLGDFKLYHSTWGGVQVSADTMAENFISFFNAQFLHLLLPHRSITQSENSYETTIDFIFASPPLKHFLESVIARKDFHFGSDHILVHTVFSFLSQLCHFKLWAI